VSRRCQTRSRVPTRARSRAVRIFATHNNFLIEPRRSRPRQGWGKNRGRYCYPRQSLDGVGYRRGKTATPMGQAAKVGNRGRATRSHQEDAQENRSQWPLSKGWRNDASCCYIRGNPLRSRLMPLLAFQIHWRVEATGSSARPRRGR
jgi:hypothetical protein